MVPLGARTRLSRLALTLILTLIATVPAVAAPAGRPTHFHGDRVVRATLTLDRATVAPGDAVGATIELDPDAGWHLYGAEHGDAGAPPDVAWTLPAGVRAGAIAYPPATKVVAQGFTTYEYHGPVSLRVQLTAGPMAPLHAGTVRAAITWLVCSNVCVPGGATRNAPLAVSAPPPASPWSFVPFLALAFLGGLVLNVMPCVFPVLSFKALRLINEPLDVRVRSAAAYAAGVTISCTALGATLLAVRAAGATAGWGFQLQSPVFVGTLVVVMLGLALAMSGAIEIVVPVPPRLARGAAGAGAFGEGVLVTLIASACVAPYMGAALGFALTAQPPVALGVFVALGLGLGLPPALLMATPALVRWLPKPGPWLLTARRLLALPLVATAVWLGWVFVQQIAPPAPAAIVERRDGVTAFSEANLAHLRATHRAVLVEMSAAWCITCKVNESVALDRPDVRRRLADLHVTVLRGDWTHQDPEITAYLRALGTAGVPLYVYYPPAGGIDVWPQLLTPSLVIERLARTESLRTNA